MAYSDYGAEVFKNDERRRDKENVAIFAFDEETFGEDSKNIPSGMRIYAHLFHAIEESGPEGPSWVEHIHHGIIGDGTIRVMCHKQGLPEIYELTDAGIEEVDYLPQKVDRYEYEDINFEYKGHKFLFVSGSPYEARMTEPDGTEWQCFYDYEYGDNFHDVEMEETDDN